VAGKFYLISPFIGYGNGSIAALAVWLTDH
jgi:hypothetical protein